MTLTDRVTNLSKKAWPADGLTYVEACPICDGVNRSQLYEGLIDNTVFSAPGTWVLYLCGDCKSAYLDPRPSDDTLALAYQSYHTHEAVSVLPTPEQGSGNFTLLRAKARRGYEDWKYKNISSVETFLSFLAISLWPRASSFIDKRNYYISNHPKRVLEVGFGNAAFLAKAVANGWNPVGVDFDPICVDHARRSGFSALQGGIEEARELNEQFDAICLSHVIEHMQNPRQALKTAYELLEPGGILYIDTPNITAACHQIFGRNWRGIEAPRHLCIFNWNSIEELLFSSGFNKIKRRRRSNLTRMMWRLSESVLKGTIGLDPRGRAHSTPPYWIVFKAKLLWRAQEFITLTARKPK